MDVNKADRIYAHSRILHNQGEVWDGIHDFRMSEKLSKKLMEMMAIPEEQMNGLTGIDRKVRPLYQGQYDIRWLVVCLKKMLMTDEVKVSDLPPIDPFELKKDIQQLLNFVNDVPSINWDDPQLY